MLESGQARPPSADRLAFPIAESKDQFDRSASTRRGNLSDGMWAILETFQPYRSHPNNPRESSLWFLEKLDIIDRHREFPLALTMLGPSLGIATSGPGVSVHAGPDPGPLGNDSQLLAYRCVDPAVHVDLTPTFAMHDPRYEPLNRMVAQAARGLDRDSCFGDAALADAAKLHLHVHLEGVRPSHSAPSLCMQRDSEGTWAP